MKNLLIFLAGVITGVGLLLGYAFVSNEAKNNITIFEQPGECIEAGSLTILQVLDGGALAAECLFGMPCGPIVFLLNKDGKGFYDDQEINIPKGQCVRQVGIYKYTTKDDIQKTVPIVKIQK